MEAAENGHDLCARALLKTGATIAAASIAGETALMKAAKNGHDLCVRALLDAESDPNKDDAEEKFGLSAINNGHMFICPEVRRNFTLDRRDWQSIVSGEEAPLL